jgi:DNA-binding NarL/FixJ family response regulator
MMVSIVLAEDHAIVRQGLRAILEREPGFSVAGETADGLRVADLVRQTRPDVLVLDLMMPGLNGLDVARQVVRTSPRTKVVILSMHATEAFALQALRNGVSAYVLKEATPDHLVHAIREVLEGRRYLSPPLTESAVSAYAARAEPRKGDAYDALTAREREVLHLAAEGLSNPDIGSRLGVSPRTAETHRANLMRKLGLRTRPDLVAYALGRGLLPDERDPRRSRP